MEWMLVVALWVLIPLMGYVLFLMALFLTRFFELEFKIPFRNRKQEQWTPPRMTEKFKPLIPPKPMKMTAEQIRNNDEIIAPIRTMLERAYPEMMVVDLKIKNTDMAFDMPRREIIGKIEYFGTMVRDKKVKAV